MHESPSKPVSYSQSVSNTVLVVLVVAATLALYFLQHGFNFAAYSLGRLAGTIVSLILWPALFGWFIWRFTGRRKNGGSWTFNIVLLLCAIGSSAVKLDQITEARSAAGSGDRDSAEMSASTSKSRRERIKVPGASSSAGARETVGTRESGRDPHGLLDYAAELEKGIPQIEIDIIDVTGDYLTRNSMGFANWGEAALSLRSTNAAEFAHLEGAEEFRRQRNIIVTYTKASKEYLQFLKTAPQRTEAGLLALGPNHPSVQMASSEIRKLGEESKPLIDYLPAGLAYAEDLLAILNFVEGNHAEIFDNSGNIIQSAGSAGEIWQKVVAVSAQKEAELVRLENQLKDQLAIGE